MAGHSTFKHAAIALLSASLAGAQTATSTVTSSLVSTGANAQFTIPSEADVGANLLPNVYDTAAVQAQEVCPGYKASTVQQNKYGFTASLALAGPAVCLS